MDWHPIETAPMPKKNERLEVLCGFQGQFSWVSFVCFANGPKTMRHDYAKPTHWCLIPEPPK